MRITELAHQFIRQTAKADDWVVDATVGNGHDTLFLANQVGPTGRVFGFDIQQQAINATSDRVKHLPQVTLIHAGHETLTEQLREYGISSNQRRLTAVMFNLGYLPGGDKAITTKPETTLAGLEQALSLMVDGGAISIVLYPGHAEGAKEAQAIRSFAKNLPHEFEFEHHLSSETLKPAPELMVVRRLAQN